MSVPSKRRRREAALFREVDAGLVFVCDGCRASGWLHGYAPPPCSNRHQRKCLHTLYPCTPPPPQPSDDYQVTDRNYYVPTDTLLVVHPQKGLLSSADPRFRGNVLQVTIPDGPSIGFVNLSADGSFTYTPPLHLDYGHANISYVATNGSDVVGKAGVLIHIGERPLIAALG